VETVDVFSSDELETLIKTAGFRLPARSLPIGAALVPYHHRLLEVISHFFFFFFLSFISLLMVCPFCADGVPMIPTVNTT